MSRKSKYSKEVKIKACEDYLSGIGSLTSLSKSIGCNGEGLRQWILKYKTHGAKVFDNSSRNRTYTKDFQQSVIDEYLSGKYSLPDLAVKYNMSDSNIRKWLNKSYNGIELKDYNPKGDIYTMKSRKTIFEERLEIVQWVISNDMSYKKAAIKFNNNYANIYKWTKAYMTDGDEALKDKRRGPKLKDNVNEDSLDEIDKLKLELERERTLRKRREFELEVLKKKEEFENKRRFRK